MTRVRKRPGAHEEDAFAAESSQVLQENIVLAQPLLEREERDSLVVAEILDPSDRMKLLVMVRQRGGRKGVASVMPTEPNHAAVVLKAGR